MQQYPAAIIAGKSHAGKTGLEVLEPATGQPVARLGEADAALVDEAVGAARAAFEAGTWRKTPVDQRQAQLRACADAIDAHAAELADLECLNTGIPLRQIRERMVTRAAYNFRFFADYIGQEAGTLYEQHPGYLTMVRHEAVGVAALVAPWNAPIALGAMKIAASLAFGNSAIIKPSEIAPLGVTRMVEILLGTGLPDGVLGLVNGTGPATGAALVGHRGVDRISFTGGTGTGRAIGAAAAANLKPVTMELGGKSANVIFADADFERAVDGALVSIFANNGQQCLAGSRILVQRAILDRFLAAFVPRAAALRIGDPRDMATEIGPVISEGQRQRMLRFAEIARTDGATLLLGGHALERPGFYVAPTVALTTNHDSQLCQDEIFGPFATIIAFDDEADAVRLANGTDFGLVSYVWTESLQRAMRMQEAMAAGVVWVNTPMMRELRAPFGGYGDSGIGAEGGKACAQFYAREKTITIPRTPQPIERLGLGN